MLGGVRVSQRSPQGAEDERPWERVWESNLARCTKNFGINFRKMSVHTRNFRSNGKCPRLPERMRLASQSQGDAEKT